MWKDLTWLASATKTCWTSIERCVRLCAASCSVHPPCLVAAKLLHPRRVFEHAQMVLFRRSYPVDTAAEENAAVIRVKYDVAQALAQQITLNKQVRSRAYTFSMSWVSAFATTHTLTR